MNVSYKSLSGSVLYANFAPEHEISIVQYYANAFALGEILGFEIRDNNSALVARGGRL